MLPAEIKAKESQKPTRVGKLLREFIHFMYCSFNVKWIACTCHWLESQKPTKYSTHDMSKRESEKYREKHTE